MNQIVVRVSIHAPAVIRSVDEVCWLPVLMRRVFIILGCALTLWVLGVRYADYHEDELIGYDDCVANPALDGFTLVFPLWIVTAVHPGGYEISKVLSGVPIEGSPEGIAVGDTITVRGAYRAADQAVVETQHSTHPLRWAKRWLSLLGTVLVAVWLPTRFWWQRGLVEHG